ncbi:Hypothetical predicted protein [Octopus vulgaris]|uniref:Uncharacterized protein n=1 Tax=Octopus vulgaris TaxID=6645 RepID=A0AA36AHT7_OCTVU|nr:Hypothetical predicted protein [Octopus vulgaris]
MRGVGTRKTNMNTRKRSVYTEQEDSEPEVSDPSQIVSTMGALYEAFGFKSVSSSPGKTKRESTQMEDFDEAPKKQLLKLTSTIIKKVCSFISPYDAEGFMKEVVKSDGVGVVDEGKLSENIIKV